MKIALVKDSRIVQIADQPFTVHPDFQWVPVPDNTTTNDLYENGQVVKFVTPNFVIEKTSFDRLTDILLSKEVINNADVEVIKDPSQPPKG